MALGKPCVKAGKLTITNPPTEFSAPAGELFIFAEMRNLYKCNGIPSVVSIQTLEYSLLSVWRPKELVAEHGLKRSDFM